MLHRCAHRCPAPAWAPRAAPEQEQQWQRCWRCGGMETEVCLQERVGRQRGARFGTLRCSTTVTARLHRSCMHTVHRHITRAIQCALRAPPRLLGRPAPVVAKATRGMDIARLACTMLTECSWEAQCAR